MAIPAVIDTSVFVSALRSGGGASRQIVRRSLAGVYRPLFFNALWLEYEALLGRPVWTPETAPTERRAMLTALAAAGEWITIWFAWRSNLPDEGDNHLWLLLDFGVVRRFTAHPEPGRSLENRNRASRQRSARGRPYVRRSGSPPAHLRSSAFICGSCISVAAGGMFQRVRAAPKQKWNRR
ncbi:PIN domain-containing protein [Rhodopila globiformis]|uniref:PIN domain-containing protein n=1 Tax=Rhodopila globiformis TaxID=1071 RepID=A0A2S6NNZ2_RHOGL|nr:PIN domain-containing protein [Rhodopila globiformis]PPQ39774.1 hypothetical protein CCS01_00975 [Rhodopila globiformis]